MGHLYHGYVKQPEGSFFWGLKKAHHFCGEAPEECNLMEGADGYLHDAEDCAEERRFTVRKNGAPWKVPLYKEGEKNC